MILVSRYRRIAWVRARGGLARTIGSVSVPTREDVISALATVLDPEIRKPITELNMVSSVDIAPDGRVRVAVLLTVPGCPMKDRLTRDVSAAVSRISGITAVDVELGVMSDA